MTKDELVHTGIFPRSRPTIYGFKEPQYAFLSNMAAVNVNMDGTTYPSVEHAYQAAKTFSRRERNAILNCITAFDAKRKGKTLSLRDDWEQVKCNYMLPLLRQKFAKPPFFGMLIATGDAYIEETNTWHDHYWGVCNGYGQNKLGKMIMQIREELQ